MPLYAERLGAREAWIGLLSAGYSAMQFVFAPIWGRLSDRVGRRPVLLVSIAMTAVAFARTRSRRPSRWLLALAALRRRRHREHRHRARLRRRRHPAGGRARRGWGSSAPRSASASSSARPSAACSRTSRSSLPGLRRRGASRRRTASPPTSSCRSRSTTSRASGARTASPRSSRRCGRPGIRRLIWHLLPRRARLQRDGGDLRAPRDAALRARPEHVGYVFAYIGVLVVIVQGGLIGPLTRRFGEKRLLVAGLVAPGGRRSLRCRSPARRRASLVATAPLAIGAGLTAALALLAPLAPRPRATIRAARSGSASRPRRSGGSSAPRPAPGRSGSWSHRLPVRRRARRSWRSRRRCSARARAAARSRRGERS